jgi:hypothetical protein
MADSRNDLRESRSISGPNIFLIFCFLLYSCFVAYRIPDIPLLLSSSFSMITMLPEPAVTKVELKFWLEVFVRNIFDAVVAFLGSFKPLFLENRDYLGSVVASVSSLIVYLAVALSNKMLPV